MNTADVVSILTTARGYIARGWTRETAAVDIFGHATFPYSPRAARWCALGALCAANGGSTFLSDYPPLVALRAALPIGSTYVSAFNDHVAKHQGDVLALFDRAIAKQRRGETQDLVRALAAKVEAAVLQGEIA